MYTLQRGLYWGLYTVPIIGLMKRDTRSVDYGSNDGNRVLFIGAAGKKKPLNYHLSP